MSYEDVYFCYWDVNVFDRSIVGDMSCKLMFTIRRMSLDVNYI